MSGWPLKTGVEADADALFWIAKEATGSLRDAYTLFDQVVSFSAGSITLEKIREKLGLVGMDDLGELVLAMVASDSQRVLSKAGEILINGVAVEQLIMDLAEYFRNLLFIKSGVSRESVLGYARQRFPSEAVEGFTISQLEHALSLLLELYRNVRYSLNQRFEMELLLSRLSSLKGYLNTSELLEKIQGLRDELAAGTLSAPAGAEAAEEEVPDEPRPDAFREEVIEGMRKKKLTLAAALEKAVSWVLEGGTLRLAFADTFSENLLRREGGEVLQLLYEVSGIQARLEVELTQAQNPVAETVLLRR